jgi:glycosyltransferase involved in cell wall biosynthesis
MLISLCIFAHNEAGQIGPTIRSLALQTALRQSFTAAAKIEWEIILLANGCTDSTIEEGDQAFASISETIDKASVSTRIVNLEESGKSNAWNVFVHEISNRAAQFLVCIDADISFGPLDTIELCVNALLAHAEADVVVDVPLKDFSHLGKYNFIKWFSLQVSKEKLKNPAAIAGSFYIGRANVLRKVWMFKGLPSEDGFLAAMVKTGAFSTAQIDESKILRVYEASHFYEGISGLREIYRHEVRMAIGTAVNCYLCWDFFLFNVQSSGVGSFVKDKLDNDPRWLSRFLRNQVACRGYWVMPRGVTLLRFNTAIKQALRGNPLALLKATLYLVFDLAVYTRANKLIKSGQAVGFW